MPEALEVRGVDDLLQFVDKFVSRAYLTAAKMGMEHALLLLHGKLPEYPPPPAKGEASKHWTDKQRRYFWWAFKKGLIEVPYRRTGTLGRQFTTEVQVEGVTVSGSLGTNTPYAPWVVGPPETEPLTFGGVVMFQAPIHRGRWWQFFVVVARNLPEAEQELADTVWGEIEKQWNAA